MKHRYLVFAAILIFTLVPPTKSYSQGYAVPILSYPTGGTTVYENPINLSWYLNVGYSGITFNLQVALDSSFSTVILNADNIASGSYGFTTIPGVKYYWRVRSKYSSGGYTDFSAPSSFYSVGVTPTYIITASSGTHGAVTPAGTTNVSGYGSQTYAITPDAGYRVDSVIVDGTSVGRVSSYTFSNVTASHTIYASFTNLWTITPYATPGGTVTPSSPVNLPTGGSRSFTFTPNTGYHIDSLIIDGSSVTPASSYLFSSVSADHSVKVYFGIDTFTLTASSGTHGSISPSGSIAADYGSSKRFVITPDTGYQVNQVLVDGNPSDSASGYTFYNITASHSVSVSFKVDTLTITASAGSNGNISPSGDVTDITGSNVSFTITPNTGYNISDVVVDGNSAGAVSSYTFVNLKTNHTISASFSVKTFTVAASAGSHGSISPSGSMTVNYGASKTFTAVPDSGYSVDSLVVNGTPIWGTASYTFSGINQNNTISAYFRISGKIYVSPSGHDTSDGSLAHPLETIDAAIARANTGDEVVLLNGSFTYQNTININKSLTITGSGSSIAGGFIISADDITIKNVQLSTVGSGGVFCGIVCINHSNITLDGITADIQFQNNYGLQFDDCSNITISNSIIKHGMMAGIYFNSCGNFSMSNVESDENMVAGLEIALSYNFNLTDVSTNLNATVISGYGIGAAFINVSDGTVTNLVSTGNVKDGLVVQASDNLKFIGGSFSNNQNNGIYLNLDNPIPPFKLTQNDLKNRNLKPVQSLSSSGRSKKLADLAALSNISNLSFTGTIADTNNSYIGLNIATGTANSIIAPVFDGRIMLWNNLISSPPLVNITGNVFNPSFNGLIVGDPNSLTANFGFIINGGMPSIPIINQPAGIKINHCIFGPSVNPAINLGGSNPATNNVDARYNDFMGASAYNAIQGLIIDSVTNSSYGKVDWSGSSFGTLPSISLPVVTNGYKGASYFWGVDIDVKAAPYYFISGKFTYDTTALQYLGTLNNGLINNAQWTFLASEPQKGTITFTAYGISPIDSDGTLFKLNMKILSGASGSVTAIACSPSDFKGNNTTGEFQTNAGTIYYSAPTGPIQSKGDVNLDMVVDMNDFYALLNHLNGTVPLTDPQALLNADFNSDGIIDVADLNDLYNFINGITPSPKIASGSLTIQNVSYGPGSDALIPFAVSSGSGISSIALTFKYDPQVISYKAFKPSIEGFGNLSYASEIKSGETRYIFTSIHTYEGNFDAGAVLLNFVKGSLPNGAVVYTSYSINGQEVRKGPAFTFTTSGVTEVVSKDNTVPSEYALSQNFPNPFNPSTVIKYSLPLSGQVRLKIFNILGREVKTLVNSYMSPGNYSVTWYGDDNAGVKVSSGTYIYRIVSDGFIQTKKMILLK